MKDTVIVMLAESITKIKIHSLRVTDLKGKNREELLGKEKERYNLRKEVK